MNSYRHAQSSARKYGGTPEDYIPIHEFIDSSKQSHGDVRHRALYHHTLGVWLCQRVFGRTLTIHKGKHTVEVPVREIAEQHILEDLGRIPSPSDYLNNMTVETWMSGAQRKQAPLASLGLTAPPQENP